MSSNSSSQDLSEFHKTEIEFLKNSRRWSIERNKLKLNYDEINSTLLNIEKKNIQLVRDLNVTKEKLKRFVNESQKYKSIANKLQKNIHTYETTSNTNLNNMENKFNEWRSESNKREIKIKNEYNIINSKYSQLKLNQNVIVNHRIPTLKFKYINIIMQYKNNIIKSRILNKWYNIVNYQKIGTSIAMRTTCDYQRRSMRDQKSRENAENKLSILKKEMLKIQNKCNNMKNDNDLNLKHLTDKIQLLEKMTKDKNAQLNEYKNEKNISKIENQMLLDEMNKLREKCIEFDAYKLTASVLEREVNMLRNDLDIAQNETKRVQNTFQTQWTGVRYELENLASFTSSSIKNKSESRTPVTKLFNESPSMRR